MLTIRSIVARITSVALCTFVLACFSGCDSGKPQQPDGKTPPTKETPATKDAPAKNGDTKDAATKDATTKDAPVKEGITKDAAKKDAAPKEPVKTDDEVISLFDGKTMGKWKATNFGGEGEVEIKDGQMIIRMGSPLSGVTWQGEPPVKMNYEISLEAQRVEGDDFFLGLTVPVNEAAISLILGGWGGTLVGLSSIDGQDASENEYTQYVNFKREQWYKVRMVVKEKQILVYIDDKQVIDASIDGRKVETRIEVDVSKPLGIATFSTTGAYRNMQVKKLK